MNFSTLSILILSLFTLSLQAQDDKPRISRSKVIDDSTKQVYGPKTTRFFCEDAIFYRDFRSNTIDTLIRDFHLYNFVQKLNYEYQDLGNIGTSMAPIFYQAPTQIGVSSGWHAFDPYWNSETVRYYDTKSPFSNMHLVLGGKGRSITDVDYTRNIKPNWNFGFNYRGLFMDKQILRAARGDRNVVSHYYDAFMTYHTKDSAYWAFFNFRRMSHYQLENGGVDVEDEYELKDFFTEFAAPNLSGPESRDLRTNFHLFHQYRISKGVEAYHIADKYRQHYQFDDTQRTSTYYDALILGTTSALDWQVYKTFRNELGLKGKQGKFFYNTYWATRKYSIDYKWLDENDFTLKTNGTEYYAGARAALDVTSTMRLSAEAESLLSTQYKAKVTLATPWLDATLSQQQYKPTFIQQLYLGAHDVWLNSFSDVTSSQLFALAKYQGKAVSISAGGTLTTLNNYIFFAENPEHENQKVLPQQSSSTHFVQSPEVRFKVTFLKKMNLSGRAVYSYVSENPDGALQLPPLLLHGQIAFKDSWVHGNFDFQLGLEGHWQSGYYANGYDVPTQQFYTQRSFQTNSFPVVDAFLNWRMKRGRMFFKYNNIVQAITKTGYFPTPYYPGQANIFDFGFDWIFFD